MLEAISARKADACGTGPAVVRGIRAVGRPGVV